MAVIYFLILLQKIGGVKILQNLETTGYLILMPLEGFQNLDCSLITSLLLLQSHHVPNYSESSVTDFKSLHSTDGFKGWESFLSNELHTDFYFELEYLQRCTFPPLASCSSPITSSPLCDFLGISGLKAPVSAEYVPLVLFLKAVPDNPFYQGTLK